MCVGAGACPSHSERLYLTGSPAVQRTSSNQKRCQGLCLHTTILRYAGICMLGAVSLCAVLPSATVLKPPRPWPYVVAKHNPSTLSRCVHTDSMQSSFQAPPSRVQGGKYSYTRPALCGMMERREAHGKFNFETVALSPTCHFLEREPVAHLFPSTCAGRTSGAGCIGSGLQ